MGVLNFFITLIQFFLHSIGKRLLTQVFFLFYRIQSFASRHRSFAAFFIVVLAITTADIIFHDYIYEWYARLAQQLFGVPLQNVADVDMGFTPEVWLALLSMVLGTLIIVISIASQSIPKLIDLYMEDWTSLFYVWFLIVSGAHAAFIKLYGEMALVRPSSRVFNIHILLTCSIIFAFPYIFYILKYTKPSNVINKIFQTNLKRIHSLVLRRRGYILNMPKIVEEFQYFLFESMNQLDDLLEYVSFKEPKADIIQNLSITIRQYVKLKSGINPLFFKVSPKVRSDISFKTMIGQFGDMETTHTFYEQKCFRLLGNIYIKLLEEGQFELASLCVAEQTSIGQTAMEIDDDELLSVLIIRFNTILRFGMKHGEKNNEPRNLYNAVFHYGNFIAALVEQKKVKHVKDCFFYLGIFGRDIFKKGKNSPALYFIVDVFAAEMKKILIQVYKNDWDTEIQNALLKELLQVDNPPDFDKEDLDRGLLMTTGVRVLQMGLALFYMRVGQRDFVNQIIMDVLDDMEVLGEATFRRVVDMTCARLNFSGPTFWEDTDRGNLNIYYTSDQDQINPFKEKVFEKLGDKLLYEASSRFLLDEAETLLLQQLYKELKNMELQDLLNKPEIFEMTIGSLQVLDEKTINTISSLRKKLGLHSENPNLRLSHTRQITTASRMKLVHHMGKNKKSNLHPVTVVHTFLNYFYIEFAAEQKEDIPWHRLKKVEFQFKPRRQPIVYQFETRFEGPPLKNGLYKVLHTDKVQVISEG